MDKHTTRHSSPTASQRASRDPTHCKQSIKADVVSVSARHEWRARQFTSKRRQEPGFPESPRRSTAILDRKSRVVPCQDQSCANTRETAYAHNTRTCTWQEPIKSVHPAQQGRPEYRNPARAHIIPPICPPFSGRGSSLQVCLPRCGMNVERPTRVCRELPNVL